MNRWHALVLDVLLSPLCLVLWRLGMGAARAVEWAGGPVDWEHGVPPRWMRGYAIGGAIRRRWCLPLDATTLYWHWTATDTEIVCRLPRKGDPR